MHINYVYKDKELIYTLYSDGTALVGTNESTSSYNAVTNQYTSIEIPDSITSNGKSFVVTEIGKCSFFKYNVLETITFPSTLVQINAQAFDLAIASFENIRFGDSVKFIGGLAFASNKVGNIFIPKGLLTIGQAAFGYSRASTSITVDSDNPNYCSDEYHNLYDKKKRILMQSALSLTSFNIPSSVRIIDHAAFTSSMITEIIIRITVTELRRECFSYSYNLKKIIIHGNPVFVHQCLIQCTALTDLFYCGSREVKGEHFSSPVTIHVCYGYNHEKFAGFDVNMSSECAAVPVNEKLSCRYRSRYNSFSIIASFIIMFTTSQ